MPNTMIERMARVLFEMNEKHAGQPTYGRDLRWTVSQSLYAEDARAVLAAMREPTDDMNIAGRSVMPEHDEPLQEDAAACWGAMIDAEALLAGKPMLADWGAGSIAEARLTEALTPP